MNQKIPATIKEQVQKLRDRGCIINDEKLAEQTLTYINYFRLSDYFAPFTVCKGQYEKDTTFENILRTNPTASCGAFCSPHLRKRRSQCAPPFRTTTR